MSHTEAAIALMACSFRECVLTGRSLYHLRGPINKFKSFTKKINFLQTREISSVRNCAFQLRKVL